MIVFPNAVCGNNESAM